MDIFKFDKKIMGWLYKLNQEAKAAEQNKSASSTEEQSNDFSGEEVFLMTVLAVMFFAFCYMVWKILA